MSMLRWLRSITGGAKQRQDAPPVARAPRRAPIVRARAEHTISRRDIDPDALKVLYRLHESGFKAYLVGGGVRDLLLGRHPKDFDVSTDAHPNQIRRLFRNCFLIGRRFRLAHIRYGTKVIETSTFRRTPDADELAANGGDASPHAHENTFGTAEEDAHRRDFTINGLFYDISTFSVIDHVGGLVDLDRRLIRSIGDPRVRFREDPVRMLRAVRFASRLGFTIEEETRRAIVELHGEILRAAPPRLFEEVYRLFSFGSGEAAFRLLRETKLMSSLFPEIDLYLAEAGAAGAERFWKCLALHDQGDLFCGESTPAVAFSVLFCAPFRLALSEAGAEGVRLPYLELAEDLLKPFAERFRVSKAIYFGMLRIFQAQQRLDDPSRRRGGQSRFVAQEHFRDAVTVAGLYREAFGEDDALLNEWRRLFDEMTATGQVTPAPPQEGAPTAEGEAAPSAEGETAPAGEGGERPKRRRRPRRRSRARYRGEAVPGAPAESAV